jgi:hypothetical protein
VPLRVWRWLVLGGFVFSPMVEAEKLILRTLRASRGAPVAADAGR